MLKRFIITMGSAVLLMASTCQPNNNGGTDHPLSAQGWPEEYGINQNTSFNAVHTPFGLKPFIKWKTSIGDIGYSSPVLGPDGEIWVGTIKGEIVGINPDDGSEFRRRGIDTTILSAPAINPDTNEIFALGNHLSSDGKVLSKLYRLDRGLALLAVSDRELGTTAAPKLWKNFVFEASNGGLTVFDQTGLSVIDQQSGIECFNLVCGSGGDILAFSLCLVTLQEADRLGVENECCCQFIPSPLAIQDASALIIDNANIVGNADTPIVIEISATCANAFRFDPSSSTPLKLLWSKLLVPLDCLFQEVLPSSPVLNLATNKGPGVIFTTLNTRTFQTRVWALDPLTGDEIWTRDLNEGVVYPPVTTGFGLTSIVTAQHLITLNNDGSIDSTQSLNAAGTLYGTVGNHALIDIWGAAVSLDHIYVATDKGLHTMGFTSEDSFSFDNTIAQSVDAGMATPILGPDGTVYVSNAAGTLVAYSADAFQIQSFTAPPAPNLQWQTPADSSTIGSASGQVLVVGVTAQDGSAFDGTVTFTSDLDDTLCDAVAVSNGVATCTTTQSISIGAQTLTAFATSGDGAAQSAIVHVTVADTAPTVAIAAPANKAVFAQNSSIDFEASVSDPDQDSFDTDKIQWTSSLDGAIGTGLSFSKSLSLGTHIITATATDNAGVTGAASATITVLAAPTVTILSPKPAAVVEEGKSITFTAMINDPNQATFTADQIQWTSSRDGNIGTGLSFTKVLSRGTHTVTVTVTDNQNVATSNSVSVIVDARPIVAIQMPTEGTTLISNTPSTFSATVVDGDQTSFPSSSIQWNSNIEGKLGTGATISATLKTNGNQTITVTVTDAHGLTASASVHILVSSGVLQ